MIIIPFDPELKNNTWNLYTSPNGKRTAITRCSNGHIGSLLNHTISNDGSVTPSVVCQHEGCNYHEYIKLDGWENK